MPMILPQEPGLAELLGSGMGQGIQGGLQQLMQRRQQEQQAAKAMPLYQQLFPEMSEQQVQSLASQPMQIQQEMIAGLMKQRQEQTKAEAKEKPTKSFITPEVQEDLRNVMQRQLQLHKEGGPGLTSGVKKLFSAKDRENIAEFQTLSSRYEAALLPLLNKGVLSHERFNYLMSLLPKANDTEATARGKMKGLAREFGIEMPEFEGRGEEKATEKKLDEQNARKFLKAAKGNKEKARELARKS